MTENFSNLVKEKGTQVQDVQRVSNEMNPERPTPIHITIKMKKFKDKENPKSGKRKALCYLQESSHKTVR